MTTISILYGSDFGEKFIKNIARKGFERYIVYNRRIVVSGEFLEDVRIEVPKADFMVAIDLHPDILLELPSILDGYKALIVPIERPLPRGLVNQLIRFCRDRDLEIAIPKPFCSLDPDGGYVKKFVDILKVGKPIFKIKKLKVGNKTVIRSVEVVRDSPCGLSQFVAEKLMGFIFRNEMELLEYLSKLHHSYPCTASMQIDRDCGDTLLHISGYILRGAINKALRK